MRSGRVPENESENWNAISAALDKGYRGLYGGLTLAQFLAAARGKRNHNQLPCLSVRQILEWADAHHARHGTWPIRPSGAIPNSGGESWARIDFAFSRGTRRLFRQLVAASTAQGAAWREHPLSTQTRVEMDHREDTPLGG